MEGLRWGGNVRCLDYSGSMDGLACGARWFDVWDAVSLWKYLFWKGIGRCVFAVCILQDFALTPVRDIGRDMTLSFSSSQS